LFPGKRICCAETRSGCLAGPDRGDQLLVDVAELDQHGRGEEEEQQDLHGSSVYNGAVINGARLDQHGQDELLLVHLRTAAPASSH
jgi:hypothetical protein